MKGAVRCESLDLAGLVRAENHGKRLDRSSARRKVRDTPPLVVGGPSGLDLTDRFKAHLGAAKQNAAAKKPVLHFIVRFPPEVLADDTAPGPFAALDRSARERLMVRQAVDFINTTHGGSAVFAARLDRDEEGESIVDVFAAPLYVKETRKGDTLWTSPTKFGKALALRHQDEIRGRSPEAEGAKAITSPRAVGIALQAEFLDFFEARNGIRLERTAKERAGPDRLGVEEYKHARQAWDQAEAEARQRVEEAEREAEAARIRVAALNAAASVVLTDITEGRLYRDDETGKVKVSDPDTIRAAPEIAPLLRVGLDINQTRKKAAEAEDKARKAKEAADQDRTAAAELKRQSGHLLAKLEKALDLLKTALRITKLPPIKRNMVKGFLDAIEKDPVITKAREERKEERPDSSSPSFF